MVRVSFHRVPSPYPPSLSIWMESIPDRVAAEPGISEITAQTLSGLALTCCVRVVLWSMQSSLAGSTDNRHGRRRDVLEIPLEPPQNAP